MKKKIIILIIVVILVILTLLFIFSNKKEKVLLEGQKLNSSFIDIYDIDENSKMYSEYTDIKFIDKKGNATSLGDALKDGNITIDKLISNSDSRNDLNDGGTSIYYFDGNKDLFDKKVDIVKCHHFSDNYSPAGDSGYITDVYIVADANKIIDNLCIER